MDMNKLIGTPGSSRQANETGLSQARGERRG